MGSVRHVYGQRAARQPRHLLRQPDLDRPPAGLRRPGDARTRRLQLPGLRDLRCHRRDGGGLVAAQGGTTLSGARRSWARRCRCSGSRSSCSWSSRPGWPGSRSRAGSAPIRSRRRTSPASTPLDALLTGHWTTFGDAAAHLVLPVLSLVAWMFALTSRVAEKSFATEADPAVRADGQGARRDLRAGCCGGTCSAMRSIPSSPCSACSSAGCSGHDPGRGRVLLGRYRQRHVHGPAETSTTRSSKR